MTKKKIDKLLVQHKAQAVGDGYIDIIVPRAEYQSLVRALLGIGVRITCVSWWEYVPRLSDPNTYGMGGPKSNFFDGWFAECGIVDDVPQYDNADMQCDAITALVEDKCFETSEGIEISFRNTVSLTPALWLNERS